MAGSNIDRQRYNGLMTGTTKPTLGAAMLIGDLTITFSAALKYAGGQAVPNLTGNQFIALTLEPDTALEEIVWLTAYTSGATTGSILRAQEGSVASAHAKSKRF